MLCCVLGSLPDFLTLSRSVSFQTVQPVPPPTPGTDGYESRYLLLEHFVQHVQI